MNILVKKYWWQVTSLAMLAVVIAMLATFLIQQRRILGSQALVPDSQSPFPEQRIPLQEPNFERHMQHELGLQGEDLEKFREQRTAFHSHMKQVNQQKLSLEHKLVQNYLNEEMDSTEFEKMLNMLGKVEGERHRIRLQYMLFLRNNTPVEKREVLDSIMNDMMTHRRGYHQQGQGKGKGQKHRYKNKQSIH